jgi:hypothetical protein
LAVSLVAGGWSYALAAVFCPHAGCAPAVASAGHASHGEAGAAAEHGSQKEHDSHNGHEAEGQGHDAPVAAQDAACGTAPAARGRSLGGPHDDSCGHCVGRPAPKNASEAGRQAEQPRRQDDGVATVLVADPKPLPDRRFVREVIPSQGAPPGRVSPHLLNSVFRI